VTRTTPARPIRALAAALGLAASAAVSLAPAPASAESPLTPPAPYPGPYTTAPPVITDWDASQPVPGDYTERKQIRMPLVVAGSVVFGLAYLPPAIGGVIGAAGGHPGGGLGLIPIVGPFALTSQYHGSAAVLDVFLVADGIAQIAGAAAIVTGLAMPRRVLVKNDTAKVHLAPTPLTFGKNSAGVGLVGTF
jgi:hypothetical protein